MSNFDNKSQTFHSLGNYWMNQNNIIKSIDYLKKSVMSNNFISFNLILKLDFDILKLVFNENEINHFEELIKNNDVVVSESKHKNLLFKFLSFYYYEKDNIEKANFYFDMIESPYKSSTLIEHWINYKKEVDIYINDTLFKPNFAFKLLYNIIDYSADSIVNFTLWYLSTFINITCATYNLFYGTDYSFDYDTFANYKIDDSSNSDYSTEDDNDEDDNDNNDDDDDDDDENNDDDDDNDDENNDDEDNDDEDNDDEDNDDDDDDNDNDDEDKDKENDNNNDNDNDNDNNENDDDNNENDDDNNDDELENYVYSFIKSNIIAINDSIIISNDSSELKYCMIQEAFRL